MKIFKLGCDPTKIRAESLSNMTKAVNVEAPYQIILLQISSEIRLVSINHRMFNTGLFSHV
jgi:hypothetical protein